MSYYLILLYTGIMKSYIGYALLYSPKIWSSATSAVRKPICPLDVSTVGDISVMNIGFQSFMIVQDIIDIAEARLDRNHIELQDIATLPLEVIE
jgi:hypothetical protein